MSEHDGNHAGAHNMAQAVGRGFAFRCPNCGHGKLFRGFLTLVDHCEECGEPLSPYEPDLLLALLVGLVVVTVVAIVFFVAELSGAGSPLIYLTLLFPIAAAVTFLVLRPFKGALVGLMWSYQSDMPNRDDQDVNSND